MSQWAPCPALWCFWRSNLSSRSKSFPSLCLCSSFSVFINLYRVCSAWSQLIYSKSPHANLQAGKLSKVQMCFLPMWGMSEMMILQLYHLPPTLPPPISNSSCLFTQRQHLCVSRCTVLLYFSRCCTVRFKMSYFCVSLFFRYYLCEK